ncbi:PPOX class F420-dependent oxidoreductase [Microbacteriaceae bacterium VKM Ac-2855]|nr:PPOX class F420-dependent oxidoreductase [Microbacteriaceae bacterium VKM Ac-2855]
MPLSPLPANIAEFLRRPNPSVVALIKPSGELLTTATWYELVDDRTILLNMDASRARLKYLRQDPRVALTVIDADDWGTHVSISGTVTQIRPDPELADIDRLSHHYTGHALGDRDSDRWSAIIDITRWHGWKAKAPINP